MAITLPTAPVPATRIAPKILMLYGMPKVGKTEVLSILTQLTRALVLDTEGGTDMYDMTKVPIYNSKDVADLATAVITAGNANVQAGKKGDDQWPYLFMAIDTLDRLEEIAEISATQKYKNSEIGKNFKGASCLELAHGLGYGLLREEVKNLINTIAGLCKYLILISHTDEKQVEKDNVIVTTRDISLTGKLKKIVPAMSDAIGYLYRTPVKGGDELWVNFETLEGATMGSRYKYLAGKKMKFDWASIYPELAVQPQQPAE